jgi:outer membrane protein assembly factor BamB
MSLQFRFPLVFSLTGLTFATMASAGDSVKLKPKYDAPSNTYVEFDTQAVQKMAGPDGKPMVITQRSVYGLLEKATQKDGSIEIEATLDRLLGSMSFSDAVKSTYDSDEPDSEDASPDHRDAFALMLNAPLRITLNQEGLAKAVSGAEPVRKRLLALGDQNFVAKGLAEGDFTDRQVMSTFGELPLVLLANREVKVGETWKKVQQDEYQQVGKVIVSYECKLDRIEKAGGRDIADISFKGVLAKDLDEKPTKDHRLGKVDGTFTGTAKFDVEQGRFVEIQRDAEAKLEVPPWWTKEPNAPLLKIESSSKQLCTVTTASERLKRRGEITQRVAEARARRDAEEAAAMSGPIDPVTPQNAPVPWLQWGGPNHNFCSDSTGLANRWPKEGPSKLWQRQFGDGFSAIVSDGDTLYTMYAARDKADPFKGDEVIVALDAKTGKTTWEHKYPAPWPKDLQMEFGPGPHSTPALVGDRLFAVGCTAKLFCLDKKSGKVVWSKDLHEEYKAGLLMRGYGASPIAYKENILLPVSKEKGHAVMAFNQKDGSVVWQGGDFEPGYATLQVINVDGVEQLVAFSGTAVIGLDPTNGKTTWKVEHPTQWTANISTPVWGPQDKFLFISSAYGMGSRGVKLEKAGSQVGAKEAWFNPKMKIQHGDAVRVGDWVYGGSGDFGPTFLACVNAKTGEFGWRQRGVSKANVLYADGKLIVLDEDGTLFLVKADPTKYRLLGKLPGICKKTAWTVPTLVGRTLYLRDREKLIALDLGAKSGD